MIGCWVNFIYKEGCRSVQIVAIDSERKFRDKEGSVRCLVDDEGTTCGFWAEQLNPIPLTPEILKKNGFSIDDSFHPHRRWHSADRRVVLHNEDEYLNTFNKWHVHIDTEDMRTIGSIELTYVHQLQQFLRLCGMNELADSFKI